MRVTVTCLVVSISLFVAPLGFSQVEDNEPGPDLGYNEQAERFMGLVMAEKYREAIDTYFSTNPWMEAQPDQLASVKAQMSGLKELVGELHGYDLISEQHFGDGFVYMLYVARFDRSPISFHMSFYKPADHWMAYTMEYKEDILPMAKELTKLKLTMPALQQEQDRPVPETKAIQPL